MKTFFVATKNPNLADYLSMLFSSLLPEDSWVNSESFSKKINLLIFDTETSTIQDFEGVYAKELPTILFTYKLIPSILQYTTKYYINGILSFEMAKTDIKRTMVAAFEKDMHYSDDMISMLFSNKINDQVNAIGSLTTRENEILEMMTIDLTNEEIANKLDVSVRTINAHKGNIMRKIGTKTTSGLVALALEYSAILKTRS